MNTRQKVAAVVLLLIATGAHAARPTSITFKTHAETDEGKPFARYTVTCNDGRSVPLTAWESQRMWCVGDASAGNCEKHQISAAKTACMLAPPADTLAKG